jgi:site-specific DNA-methyltransferase (adenine-specific)
MKQKNKTELHLGDCLSIMKKIDTGSVSMVYLDPPFLTQRVHSLTTKDRKKVFSFSDIWNSSKEYGDFIGERMLEVHRILSNDGTLFFHCDRRTSHIARLVLDEVFGQDMFISEIVWSYRRWTNQQKSLIPSHQNIYLYSKTENYKFNTLYGDYSETTNIDQILQKRMRDKFGKSVYQKDDDGEIVFGGGKKGVPLGDVWEIPYLNPKSNERTGYPTQKPLSLLERIIEISTDENDTVLDPFCGSGTTLVAANLLGRNAIGIDISNDALGICKKRIENPIKSTSNLLKNGRESYNNADESLLAILQGIDFFPVQRNNGIDAILKNDLDGTPIVIRLQKKGESITEAAMKLYSAGKSKNSKLMILVSIDKDEPRLFSNDYIKEIIVVKSTALSIKELIDSRLTNKSISAN